MTRPLRIALGALALLLMLPAVVGLVDAWCWTMLGRQVTGIEWSEGRVVVALMLLIPAVPSIATATLIGRA